MRLRRDAVLPWRDMDMGCGGRPWARASWDVDNWLMRLCDVDDDVLRCLREVGIVKPEPERSEGSETGSWLEVAADADDVLDATDAFWAARSNDSSRVRRLTWSCQYDSKTNLPSIR